MQYDEHVWAWQWHCCLIENFYGRIGGKTYLRF
jgi:hypothetical protein